MVANRVVGVHVLALGLFACGSGDASGPGAGGGAGEDARADAGGGAGALTVPGVWQVDGADSIGSYTGQIEIVTEAGGTYRFTRVVRYVGLKVEDGRELWWVFSGTASGGAPALTLASSLNKADFIRSRGSLTRTDADKSPVAVSGSFSQSGAGLSGSFTGPDIAATESWTSWTPSGAPIFATDRTVHAAHAPPGSAEKAAAFQAYASYQSLPAVSPWASNPDFQAAIHGYFLDRTDAQFYLDHPDAVRVVQKVIDPISTLETLSRANAFRFDLKGKAAYFDAETSSKFVEPVGGMLAAARHGASLEPSGDAALWTGVYAASQAYRWEVTKDAGALANLVKSLTALLTCQEITGDKSTFARTLRPIAELPANDPEWHAGTGPYSQLAWKQGGNNDMLKGLLYGYITGYRALCTGLGGYDALCERIRTDAYDLADHIDVAQKVTSTNYLTAQWLAAYVRNESCPLFNANHRTRAAAAWAGLGTALSQGNGMTYTQFTGADWSGTHLNAVQYMVLLLLARSQDVCTYGNVEGTLKDGIAAGLGQIDNQRLVPWNLMYAAFVSGANPSAADDARLRLRELPAPKTGADFDHRIDPGFVMGPYPALPWKNDWTTNDRTQALRGRPLFEQPSGEHFWKENPFAYRGDSAGTDSPGADYLHAYWLGRRFGVIGSAE